MELSSTTQTVVEHCWVLIGRQTGALWHARRDQFVTGEPASVEFDAQWVLSREEQYGDVVGFYHTHPGGRPTPSERDRQTMQAWVGAFGKSLLCLIESSGDVAAYRYDDAAATATPLAACLRGAGETVLVYDPKSQE